MRGPGRRVRETLRKLGWFESSLTLVGYGMYLVVAICVVIALRLILTVDEPEPGFPAGEGFVKFLKGFGGAFFLVTAAVSFFVGQWLLEARLRDERATVAAKYEASRLATRLAQEPEFQTAGSWEWRQQTAYQLVPELKEYALSDDWTERRFAAQTIKEAWELYCKQQEGVSGGPSRPSAI
ncbi:MAG: hypothetical protein ACRDKT_04560 [Actinomycetota bacterium]